MWAHIIGSQYFSKGMNDPVKGKSAWKLIQTPFFFKWGKAWPGFTLTITGPKTNIQIGIS